MKYNLLLLFACILFNGHGLFSQIDYVLYDESKGFIGGSVYGRLIDTKGRVWFGTEKGISMFENSKLTTWKKGESGLHGTTGAFSFKDYGNGLVIAATKMRRIVTMFGECSDDVYFYPEGYHVFVEGNWKYFENTFKDSSNDADICFEHRRSDVWLISKDHGVKAYPNVNMSNMHQTHDPIVHKTSGAPVPPYNTFAYDGYFLWIATEDGLYCFDFNEDKWKDFSSRKELIDVQDIKHIGKQTVFIRENDVSVYLKGEFQYHGPKERLGNMKCREQYLDKRDSSIWVASDKGILHFKDGIIEKHLTNHDFERIIPYRNGFVTAAPWGLFVYEGKEFKEYKNKILTDPYNLIKIGKEVWYLNRRFYYYTEESIVKEVWPDVLKDAKTNTFSKFDTLATCENGDILFTMQTDRESNSIYVCDKDQNWTEYEIPNKNKFIALRVKDVLRNGKSFYFVTSIGLFTLSEEGLNSLIPWDNGVRGNQMEDFFTSKWIICSNEGVIYFPKGVGKSL
jgi:ligand-binding sensor domain-containing protein